MEFKVNSGAWGSMFGIPCIVADNFLKLASEAQIKVLLYILRNNNRMCSTDEIGRAVGITAEQAEESLIFWQQANVLAESSDSANKSSENNIMKTPFKSKSETAEIKPSQKPTAIKETSSGGLKLAPTEIAKLITQSGELKGLFEMAQIHLGALNHTAQKSLIWMHDYLGLRADVIVTLIAYCASINKTNISYMEKIAYSWSESGISTFEQAQDEVNRMTEARSFVYEVMKSLEMKRNPTTKQLEFIMEWKSKGYTVPLIKYAYEKTIEQIDMLKFEYINKILINWSSCGFKSVDDVKNSELEFKNSKKQSESSADASNVDKYKALINNF